MGLLEGLENFVLVCAQCVGHCIEVFAKPYLPLHPVSFLNTCNIVHDYIQKKRERIALLTLPFPARSGDDLANILRAKSPDTEIWFNARTAFTRSLAVMSMVGYLLGLGDRHPSNLMLQRGTGRIVHIDFGDCFEVAQRREKYPERVPFRLTRMLIKAMEVGGGLC